MEGIRVTKFERHPEHGYWTARVHNGDACLPVCCKFGSWTTVPDDSGAFKELIRPLAAELTARMRTEEGREKRAQEALAETNPFVKKAAKGTKRKEAVAA